MEIGEEEMTAFHDLALNESLYISTTYHREQNESERICIGWIDSDMKGPDGTISLQVVWFGKLRGCDVLQVCLNAEEIDLVIGALNRAKNILQSQKDIEKK